MKKTNNTTPAEIADRIAKELKASSDLYKMTRRQRREEKNRIEKTKATFNKYATSYIEDILFNNNDPESEEGIRILEKWDRYWRLFARNQISRYPYIYNTPERRSSLTNYFLQFVSNYSDKVKEGKKAQSKNGENTEWGGDLIKEIHKTLEEAGVKTQAKTPKGLLKVVETKLEVGSPTYEKLKEILTSVI